ncbi:phosphoribosylformylglycinamidine cyclo-ligase [Acidianus sp. RZ1]|uniref:phosphoribosylformylglycinamidine cyclo-ligase n=1 Tax=Acidianus sp. RZ1 TaxID=1540082 RepID=UPI001491DB75|nr:phosphoribosylformylglycinamidine cyclo-ligase [Acidianus sp. RZ1]
MVSEYSRSGVDLDKVKRIHDEISKTISSTYTRTVLGAGHYSGVIEVNGIKLALHTDGVGTKTILALRSGILEPVGQDCVAMNVNDLICIGSIPLALVDYIALDKPSTDLVSKVMSGLIKASKESGVDIVGGETAIMPGVINGFDLSCTALGIVNELKTGKDIRPGDVVIGLKSNGVHSNGFSLIRRLIEEGKIAFDSWKDELMKPTALYVKPILEVLPYIKGAAHITGGSFSKIRRLTGLKVELLDMPEPQEVFKEIEKSGVPHEEMYKVFNMGIGMTLFLSKENVDEVMKTVQKYVDAFKIGEVKEGEGIIIRTYKNQILSI